MSDIRPGEISVSLPDQADACLIFIGRIHSPWSERSACPRQGDAESGPKVTIELEPMWQEVLSGLEKAAHV